MHLVFTGNPGTGKTTVARLIGQIYGSLGLLSRGHLVEVSRHDLVAGYLGQTAERTATVVRSALGGVLFIDEAHGLDVDVRADYGAEAVDTLVKLMEDHRDDLVVIAAGYPQPMQALLASNPGLTSRFARTIDFPDYSPTELLQIFDHLCRQHGYQAVPRARLAFAERMAGVPRGPGFGNGRAVRTIFEDALTRHALRISTAPTPTRAELVELHADDLTSPPAHR